jgi:hypothetical protein
MTTAVLNLQTTGGRVGTDGSSVGLRATGLFGVIDGGVTMGMLAQSGATSGQVIAWNGTAWAPATAGGASATTVEVDLGSTAKTSGRFTITNASISASSKVIVWQASGPYTGKGTLADEAAMQPVNIVAVQSGSGSCIVWWETPPMTATVPIVANGRRDAPSTAAGSDPRYPNVAYTTQRIGRIRGNVKFSYMILS